MQVFDGAFNLLCGQRPLIVEISDHHFNYANEWAIINVFRGGKQITTMYPERRFYKASQQPQTLPRIYPSFREDLFLVTVNVDPVYEGKNETTGRPIIRAHLNPLVPWIWIGLIVMVFGTITALVPNAAAVQVPQPRRCALQRTQEQVT